VDPKPNAASPDAGPQVYRRRTPEHTALFACVNKHFATFEERLSLAGKTLPEFIAKEFSGFLECGILTYGFARVRCADCGFDRLVAFSCKARGICPSCVGRRMNDTAAYLADEVFPDVPVRQWVLSMPKALRPLVAYDTKLLRQVLQIFTTALRRHLTRTAKRELGLTSVKNVQTGALTVVQRFGSAAELNVHFHTLACDGVFVHENGVVKFHALPKPADKEITAVAERVCRRVIRLLEKVGKWRPDADSSGDDTTADDADVLTQIGAASVSGTLIFKNGERPMRLIGAAARQTQNELRGYAFDLDASITLHANDKAGRERLCRYVLRPALANDRLKERGDGRFDLKLKRAWSDGTTHLVFDGPELIARLVALVPPPRVHQIRYHGVFAPNAKWRSLVVRGRQREENSTVKNSDALVDESSCDKPHKRKRYDWAKLLARVFKVDVLACPRCNSRMQRIAFITTHEAIRGILNSMGLATAPPPPSRALDDASEQREFGWT